MTKQQAATLVRLLRVILDRLREPEADVAWSRYTTADEAIGDVLRQIRRLESGDETTLAELRLLFGPTGSFQEISLSSGWGEEFLRLASQFDEIVGGAG